jgi:hypothetical protein
MGIPHPPTAANPQVGIQLIHFTPEREQISRSPFDGSMTLNFGMLR